jgi:tripartite-type tricarboxylate transporter receptor subunit TctC
MKMKLAIRIMATGTGLLLGALWSLLAAQAQSQWPDKPVVMVVPWAPGGFTDILARLRFRAVNRIWRVPHERRVR